MNLILSLFTQYLKPIFVGLFSIIGVYLLLKTEDSKAENQVLNDDLEDENKTVERQNEVIQAVNNIEPTDINGITELMRDGKL